jgi:DNA-binding SARP family transcriptional activator
MAHPHVSFCLFGGVSLHREGRPVNGRATQRRRIGVLTLLAAARTGQVSRDRLVACLWPDAETDAARHLLAGAVYELRKALGEEAILSRGDELALNPDVVDCDVARFDAALADASLDHAVGLYRGTFADGLHVSQAPEFEQWLEETRTRYQSLFQKALVGLAQLREREGALRAAAECWVRLADSDLANATAQLRAIQALDAVSEPAEALRHYQKYSTLIRREFDSEPDPRVAQLAGQIRGRQLDAALPVAAAPLASPPGSATLRNDVFRRRGRHLLLVSLAGAAALLLVALARGGGARAEVATLSETEVVVLPFEGTAGEPDLAAQLATALDQAGTIRARTGAAAAESGRSGFPLYLRTTVQSRGGELRLTAALLNQPRGAAMATAAVTGDAARQAGAVEQLALALLGQWPRSPAERLSTIAARSTRSLPALRAWLNGEQDFRIGHFLAAAENFARAVEADSGYALAFYRLSQARLAADLPETDAGAADRHLALLSATLPERDQLLLSAWAGFRVGHADYAEQRYQGLTTRYPDDLEAWLQLGETRFHYGPLRGRPVADAEEAFRKAAGLDPLNWSARWHLASLAALRGDRSEVKRSVDQLLALKPERSQELELRLLSALALEDRRGTARVLAELRDADELLLYQCLWRSAVFLRDLDVARRIAMILAEPARPTYAQILGRLTLAHLKLAGGDFQGARLELDHAWTLRSDGYIRGAWATLALVPGMPVDSSTIATMHDSLRAEIEAAPHPGDVDLLLLGYLMAARGQSDSVLAVADRLDSLGARHGALVLRAEVAIRRNRFDDALRYLQEPRPVGWYGNLVGSPYSFEARFRFLRAEALFQLGQLEPAANWYRSLGEHSVSDLAYLPQARERQAEIQRRLGRTH